MSEWIYFLHAPRENFAETITDEEAAVFSEHFGYLSGLNREDVVRFAGRTDGTVDTGLVVLTADNEEAARRIMEGDPVVAGGIVRAELHPFRLSMTPSAE